MLATAALGSAVGLAKLCGAEVTLLRVVPPVDQVIETSGEAFTLDAQLRGRRRQSEAYMAALRQRPEFSGVRLRTEVTEGPVAETILNYAQDHATDLIVMTTHGRSGLSRWVWGSIADKVLRAASTAVLLVRSGGPEPRATRSV